MNVLVTGGAGYIGSHAVRALRTAGHMVVALDNFGQGHRKAVGPDVDLADMDLRQTDGVAEVLKRHRIEGVMHFAALALVGESVAHPLRYYDNNTAGTISLVKAMDRAGVGRMIFSSTCATYGQPEQVPITEDAPQAPINPYGRSKLFVEHVLQDHAAATGGFSYAALRYFNVAGCAFDGSLGEDHRPESHIIPLLLLTALGKQAHFSIFGDDYPTPDGTCIRDYIHVEDLVGAHIQALQALGDGDQRYYNLGIGKGISVRQIIDAANEVTGQKIPTRVSTRRPGDPPMLYADPSRIHHELGWQAATTDVAAIVESAWRWFRQHPEGYGG